MALIYKEGTFMSLITCLSLLLFPIACQVIIQLLCYQNFSWGACSFFASKTLSLWPPCNLPDPFCHKKVLERLIKSNKRWWCHIVFMYPYPHHGFGLIVALTCLGFNFSCSSSYMTRIQWSYWSQVKFRWLCNHSLLFFWLVSQLHAKMSKRVPQTMAPSTLWQLKMITNSHSTMVSVDK